MEVKSGEIIPLANNCDQVNDSLLNIAASCTRTKALGPGIRSAIWLQGCLKDCEGCYSPEWRLFKEARLVHPDELAMELLSNPEITGLTISGGEPMLQAEELIYLVSKMKKERDIDVICFTGYELDRLLSCPPSEGISDFLTMIDLLIDGSYIKQLDNGKGLRGSTNQRLHYLSNRLTGFDFKGMQRKLDIQFRNGSVLFIGIPSNKNRNLIYKTIEIINRFESDYECIKTSFCRN